MFEGLIIVAKIFRSERNIRTIFRNRIGDDSKSKKSSVLMIENNGRRSNRAGNIRTIARQRNNAVSSGSKNGTNKIRKLWNLDLNRIFVGNVFCSFTHFFVVNVWYIKESFTPIFIVFTKEWVSTWKIQMISFFFFFFFL